jgi:hypothetical protein
MKPCLAGSPTELIDEILADFNRSDCELDLTDDMTMSFLKMATKWKQIDDGYVPPDIFQELKIAPPKFFKVEHYYDLLDVMNKDMQDLVYTFVLKDIERSAREQAQTSLWGRCVYFLVRSLAQLRRMFARRALQPTN